MEDEKIEKLNALVNDITEEILASGMNTDELKRFGKYLTPTKTLAKSEYAKALAWALCTPTKFQEYYNNFDAGGKEVFKELAFSSGMLTRMAIYKVMKKFDYSKYSDDPSKLPFAFILNYSYSNFISLPSVIKKCARIQLSDFLEQKNEISDEEFKETPGYFSTDDGLTFFSNLQSVIQFLIDSKFFERNLSDPILKGTLQKTAKIADFKSFTAGQKFSLDNYSDFFKEELELPKASIERTETARLSLALGFLSLAVPYFFKDKEGKSELSTLLSDPKTLYRMLLENFFNAQTTILDEKCLYPNVSLCTGYYSVDPNKFRAESLCNFITLIKKHPPEKPTKFSAYYSILEDNALPAFYKYRTIDSTTKFFYGTPSYSGGMYLNQTKEYIRKDPIYKYFVQEPGYTNLFLMLASIGLFEITWLPPCEEPKETFDIIQWQNDLNRFRYGKIGFIKITELGKYAFGITDSFTEPHLKQFAPPRLDENALIIHIDDGDKSMQLLLEPFCVQLSRTLYKADELRLKKICKTKGDVNSIFNTLTSRASGKIPKIWEDLKKSITESFVTLEGEYDWVVYSLEKQSDALIRCVERLSRIGLCIKMEGKRVAVKENKLAFFHKRIEAEGFKVN